MNVTFDPNIGKLYDFYEFISICRRVNEVIEVHKSRDITYFKELSESYRYIADGLDPDTPGLSTLLERAHGGSYNFFSQYFYLRIWDWKTADVFIENFDQLIHGDMRYDMLSYFDEEDHAGDYYRTIAETQLGLYEFIQKLNVPDKVKLELIGIVSGSELYASSLKTYFKTVAIRINDVYDRYGGIIDKHAEKMRNHLETSEEFALMKMPHFKADYEANHFENVRVSMSFLNPIIVVYWNTEDKVDIYLGMENQYQHSYSNGSISKYSLFFKALSDDSRIRIIELLRERELYIGEISKALEIPLTTLSYHIRMLSEAEIILTREEGKKTYCIFRPEEFNKAMYALGSIAGIPQNII